MPSSELDTSRESGWNKEAAGYNDTGRLVRPRHTLMKKRKRKRKILRKEKRRFFELKGRSLVSSFVGGGADPSCSKKHYKAYEIMNREVDSTFALIQIMRKRRNLSGNALMEP